MSVFCKATNTFRTFDTRISDVSNHSPHLLLENYRVWNSEDLRGSQEETGKYLWDSKRGKCDRCCFQIQLFVWMSCPVILQVVSVCVWTGTRGGQSYRNWEKNQGRNGGSSQNSQDLSRERLEGWRDVGEDWCVQGNITGMEILHRVGCLCIFLLSKS